MLYRADRPKRRKWIKRPDLPKSKVVDAIAIFTAEIGCQEAIEKINAAAQIGDRAAVKHWRATLEQRCPGLRDVLRRHGHTLEPAHREKLTIMDRGLAQLLRPWRRR